MNILRIYQVRGALEKNRLCTIISQSILSVKFSLNIEFNVLLENILLDKFQSISLSARYYRLNDK